MWDSGYFLFFVGGKERLFNISSRDRYLAYFFLYLTAVPIRGMDLVRLSVNRPETRDRKNRGICTYNYKPESPECCGDTWFWGILYAYV